jgi:hypothetical protein
MATPTTSIFRREALEYRARNQGHRQEAVSFPRLMARHIRIALWLVIAVLGLGAAIACLPTVPVNAAGLAVATTETRQGVDGPLVAVLTPAGDHDAVEPGSAATVTIAGQERAGTVAAVEPAPLAPIDAARRLGLDPAVTAMLPGPVTLAWIALDGAGDVPDGALGQARISIGSRQAGSYLPLVGQLF